MAYRFQDLQGNWRMRYDDGTTSLPINADDLGPQDRTSTTEVNDDKGMWRNSYGVDTSFAGSRFDLNLTRDPNRIGAADGDRQRELANAIIDGEMSKNRVATYTSEFKPLAEMHSTQDVLIKSVASNVAADPEARAGAFQALYPGMQVTVGQQGILQFQAARSDLGFSYPDKVKAEEKARTWQDPNLASSPAVSPMETLNSAMTRLQQAPDEVAMGTILSDAASAMSVYLKEREDAVRSELFAEYPIAKLEQELQESVLNDNYWKNVRNQRGEPTFGESGQTKDIRQQLSVFETSLKARVTDRLAEDSEITRLKSQYSTLQAVYNANLQRTITTPELLPEGVLERFAPVWNGNGMPMTPQQRSELADALAKHEPHAMTFAGVASGSITEMVLAYDSLGPVYSSIVERAADQRIGEPGAFKSLKDSVDNFEESIKKAGVILTDQEQDILTSATPTQLKLKTPEEAAQTLKEVKQFKIDKIVELQRQARDAQWDTDITNSQARPPETDGYSADYWESAIKAVRSDAQKAAIAANIPGILTPYIRREEMERNRREIAKDPTQFIQVSVADVLRKMGSQMAGQVEFRDDPELGHMAVKEVAKTMTEWLRPQIENPKNSNLLGRVKTLDVEQITSHIVGAYEAARIARLNNGTTHFYPTQAIGNTWRN